MGGEGSSIFQSLGRICPGLAIKERKARLVEVHTELVRVGWTGSDRQRQEDGVCQLQYFRLRRRGLGEGFVWWPPAHPPLTGSLALGMTWDVQVRLHSTANLRGYYVTCPADFSFSGPPVWHQKHLSLPLLHFTILVIWFCL